MEASMFSMFNMHVHMCVHVCACMHAWDTLPHTHTHPHPHPPPLQGGGPPESLKIR